MEVTYPRNCLLLHIHQGWFASQPVKDATVPTGVEIVADRFARVNAISLKRMYTWSSTLRLDESCRSFQLVSAARSAHRAPDFYPSVAGAREPTKVPGRTGRAVQRDQGEGKADAVRG